MPKFRKKPVETEADIEAVLWNGTQKAHRQIALWEDRRFAELLQPHPDKSILKLYTFGQDNVIVKVGDWVIRELFPQGDVTYSTCPPKLFEEMYEPIGEFSTPYIVKAFGKLGIATDRMIRYMAGDETLFDDDPDDFCLALDRDPQKCRDRVAGAARGGGKSTYYVCLTCINGRQIKHETHDPVEALEEFARDSLKEGLAKCTEAEQLKFRQMYAHKSPNKSINDIVDFLREEDLDWAMQQVKNTLAKKEKDNE